MEIIDEVGPNNAVTGILNKGAYFKGNLIFEGTVRIAGKFEGEIYTNDTLVIAAEAQVKANINANTVILEGHLTGEINAKKLVVMKPPAVFKGAVCTPSLKISEGVVFEGASKMEVNFTDPSPKVTKETNATY